MRRAPLLVALVLLLAAGCTAAVPETATTTLPARTIPAGEVEVIVEPLRLDPDGASFSVSLDTHTVELDMDLTGARLTVDGTSWGTPTWDGPDAGGHHRSGTLSFEPAGPARGTAELTMDGFSEPVVATWDLG